MVQALLLVILILLGAEAHALTLKDHTIVQVDYSDSAPTYFNGSLNPFSDVIGFTGKDALFALDFSNQEFAPSKVILSTCNSNTYFDSHVTVYMALLTEDFHTNNVTVINTDRVTKVISNDDDMACEIDPLLSTVALEVPDIKQYVYYVALQKYDFASEGKLLFNLSVSACEPGCAVFVSDNTCECTGTETSCADGYVLDLDTQSCVFAGCPVNATRTSAYMCECIDEHAGLFTWIDNAWEGECVSKCSEFCASVNRQGCDGAPYICGDCNAFYTGATGPSDDLCVQCVDPHCTLCNATNTTQCFECDSSSLLEGATCVSFDACVNQAEVFQIEEPAWLSGSWHFNSMDVNGAGDVMLLAGGYVYENDSLTFILDENAGFVYNDRFGCANAITEDGTLALVGAYGMNSTGRAYFYQKNGDIWSREDVLVGDDSIDADKFGIALAWDITGHIAAIAATGSSSSTGAVYVFRRDISTNFFYQLAKLTASDGGNNDQLGFSLDMNANGTVIAIGAFQDDDVAFNSGACYMFVQDPADSTTWNQEQKLAPADLSSTAYFGYSVSMENSGKLAAIGAYNTDAVDVADSGAVYVYTRDSFAMWSELVKLTASDAASGDTFGSIVRFNAYGDTLLISSKSANTGTGAIYLFIKVTTSTNETFTEGSVIARKDGTSNEFFGSSLALNNDGSSIVAVAPFASAQGIVSVFKQDCEAPTFVSCPPDKFFAANENGNNLTYNADDFVVSDNGDINLVDITCDPPSGTVFEANTLTNVECLATDAAGNIGDPCDFNVQILAFGFYLSCPTSVFFTGHEVELTAENMGVVARSSLTDEIATGVSYSFDPNTVVFSASTQIEKVNVTGTDEAGSTANCTVIVDFDECEYEHENVDVSSYCPGTEIENCINLIGGVSCAVEYVTGSLGVAEPLNDSVVMDGSAAHVLLGSTAGDTLTFDAIFHDNDNLPLVFFGEISLEDGEAEFREDSLFPCTNLHYNETLGKYACDASSGSGFNYVLSFWSTDAETLLFYADDMVSYRPPEITALTLRSVEGDPGFDYYIGESAGSEIVRFDGFQLGYFPDHRDMILVQFGPDGYAPQECKVQDGSTDTQIVCFMGAALAEWPVNAWMTFTVFVGPDLERSVVGTDVFKYPIAPTIEHVLGCTTEVVDGSAQATLCPTAGNVGITLIGMELEQDILVDVNFISCTLTGYLSSGDVANALAAYSLSSETATSGITCELPGGVGAFRSVVASQKAEQSFPSYSMSYAEPVITSFSGCAFNTSTGGSRDCLLAGGERMTLTGSNFGITGATLFVGAGRCESLVHDTENPNDILYCTMPAGTPGVTVPLLLLQENGLASVSETVDATYLDCVPGTFQNPDGDDCLNCTVGSFTSDSTTKVTCAACEPGSFQNDAGKTFCSTCESGTFQIESGMGNCSDCAPGSYTNDETVKLYCALCPSGKFNNAYKQADCDDCPAGKYASNAGATSCDLCVPGQLSLAGSASCFECTSDTEYTAQNGSSSCSSCPAFSVSADAHTTCICEPLYYDDLKGDGIASCEPCVEGMICDTLGVTVESLELEPGYWRESAVSGDVFECFDIQYCDGGAFNESAVSGQCTYPRTGPLCASCVDGYLLDSNNECSQCENTELYIYVALGAFVLVIFVLGAYVSYTIRTREDDTNPASILVKILLSALQANAIAASFSFNWEAFFSEMLEYEGSGGSMGLSLLNAKCLWQNFESGVEPFFMETLVFLSFPLLVFILPMFFLGPFYAVKVKLSNGTFPWSAAFEEVKEMFATTIVIILFLAHPTLARRTLLLFSCTALGDDDYVTEQPNVVCQSEEHVNWIIFAGIPMIIMYVFGIPLAGLFILLKYKEDIRNEDADAVESKTFLHYTFLYKGYAVRHARKKLAFIWELVVTLRKVALLFVAVFLYETPQVQGLIGVVLLVISLFLHTAVRPFETKMLNLAEFLSLLTTFLTFLLGQFTYVDTTQVSDNQKVMISFMALIFNVAFIIVIILMMVKGQVSHLQREREEDRRMHSKAAKIRRLESDTTTCAECNTVLPFESEFCLMCGSKVGLKQNKSKSTLSQKSRNLLSSPSLANDSKGPSTPLGESPLPLSDNGAHTEEIELMQIVASTGQDEPLPQFAGVVIPTVHESEAENLSFHMSDSAPDTSEDEEEHDIVLPMPATSDRALSANTGHQRMSTQQVYHVEHLSDSDTDE